jgi:predicted dienelactone hydrolase
MTRPIALAIALLTAACAAPAPERPAKVGRVARSWVDEQRPHWDEAGPRPLATMLWYPAVTTAVEEEWRVGGPPLLTLFRAGWSAPDAEPVAGAERRPLIVLSHGTGGAAAQLSWLAEVLASHGYIVAAVNHHGNTAFEPVYLPQGFVLIWERPRDLSVVIDRVLEDAELGPRIDPGRIGAAGFSLGGYSVLALAGARADADRVARICEAQPEDPGCQLPPEATFTLDEVDRLRESDSKFQASMARHAYSYEDARVRAVYAIAPVGRRAIIESSLGAVRIPVRMAVGDRDPQAPMQEDALPLAAAIPGSQLFVVPEVAHYTFLSTCSAVGRLLVPSLCSDPEGVDREAIHELVARDVLRFFEERLGGRISAACTACQSERTSVFQRGSTQVIATSSAASRTSRKVATWKTQAGPPVKSTKSAIPIATAVPFAAQVW